jgi:transcription termination/antitermination protein NusG
VAIAVKGRSDDCLENSSDQADPDALALAPQWYALYTRSHCEQLVHDQLQGKGFSTFLPKLEVWTQRSGKRSLTTVPMFPSYLFIHHAMEKMSYIEVCKARGLVRILGERWDRLGSIPDGEIEAIQHVLQARLPVLPHPYLQKGQRVRIMQGPLTGTEGIFVQSKPNKGLVVLSVELLQRSVAVEVDCSIVSAA